MNTSTIDKMFVNGLSLADHTSCMLDSFFSRWLIKGIVWDFSLCGSIQVCLYRCYTLGEKYVLNSLGAVHV